MPPTNPPPKQDRLTESTYWNSAWARLDNPTASPQKESALRRLGRTLLGDRWNAIRFGFAAYDYWDRLLPRYVSPSEHNSVVEVGSAPGRNLLEFRQRFGHNPYGVEYTPSGVAANRQTFSANGIDPEQVIEADFLSEAFQSSCKDKFDVVMSAGFIEHFTEMDEVIADHLNILKPGGLLIISIPNLSGIHHWMVERSAPDLLEIHNLAIMNLPTFRGLFDPKKVEHLFCGHQGGINLLMAAAGETRLKPNVLSVLRYLQLGFTVLQLAVRWDSHLTSSNLVFIGRKR